jgi:hypothetical protein
VGVAELIGKAAQMHRLAEVLLSGLLIRADAGKEVQAELHDAFFLCSL